MICIEAKLADFIRRFQHRFENQLRGEFFTERFNDFRRMNGNLLEGLRSIKVLAASDEPDFEGVSFFHNFAFL